ncbi:MAG: TIGR02147 family protein [Chitinivibrionales bacterium]
MSAAVTKTQIKLEEYSDFREYLRDLLDEQRRMGNRITNRSFAAAAGVNSASWLTSILQGKKGVAPKTARVISDFLGHNEKEQAYFNALIRFNLAKTLDQRNTWFNELNRLRKREFRTSSAKISNAQYEFYSRWYYTAVRSLIGIHKIGEEYEKIASMVSPSITSRQAKKAISVLKKLGMIRFDERGEFFELTDSAITTGRHEFSLSIANFQRETMRLASESLDRYKPGIRDISTLSVGISGETAERIKEEIRLLRKRIIDMADRDQKPDRVYHINFHFFPMSSIPEDDQPPGGSGE